MPRKLTKFAGETEAAFQRRLSQQRAALGRSQQSQQSKPPPPSQGSNAPGRSRQRGNRSRGAGQAGNKLPGLILEQHEALAANTAKQWKLHSTTWTPAIASYVPRSLEIEVERSVAPSIRDGVMVIKVLLTEVSAAPAVEDLMAQDHIVKVFWSDAVGKRYTVPLPPQSKGDHKLFTILFATKACGLDDKGAETQSSVQKAWIVKARMRVDQVDSTW